MSSSVTSVIRSFVLVLSAVGYATAQVPLGVEMVPNPEYSGSSPAPSYQGYPSNSGSSWSSSSLPVETGSPSYGSPSYGPPSYGSPPYGSPSYAAPPSQYTPPPAQPPPSYQPMPYSSFTGGGYSQMDCGYGYKKGSDGKCTPESWWNSDSWGCYQTTIIVNNGNTHQYCPPPSTVTVTDKSVETKILTVTYTQTQPIPTTVYNTVTKTDVKTDTLYVTNTETLPVTLTYTSVSVESKTLTATDIVKETLTDVVTTTDIKVIPTTFTSVWVKTDVIDRTNTIERTLTSTVVNEKTMTNTVTYHFTSTTTDVSTQTSVATSTTTQVLQETSLSECLSQCDQYKYLTPGNNNQWNTYASPPAYTPSPTYQPYQYQGGGGYN